MRDLTVQQTAIIEANKALALAEVTLNLLTKNAEEKKAILILKTEETRKAGEEERKASGLQSSANSAKRNALRALELANLGTDELAKEAIEKTEFVTFDINETVKEFTA